MCPFPPDSQPSDPFPRRFKEWRYVAGILREMVTETRKPPGIARNGGTASGGKLRIGPFPPGEDVIERDRGL